MSEGPPLTVALPTCNGARYLAEALGSILAQEGAEFDLVVSDDRSEDDTLEVVRSIAGDRARVEVNPERLGLAGNWNRCIALSRTEWVAIVHQDDVLRPGHLAWHRQIIETTPVERLGLIAGAVEMIVEGGEAAPTAVSGLGPVGPGDRIIPHLGGFRRVVGVPGLDVVGYPPGAFVASMAVGNPVRCSSATIRKAAHEQLGGFDPSYRYAVDWDFWLRLARRWGVAWLARPTVAVRWHEASETHTFKRGALDLDEQAALLRALHDADGPTFDDQELGHRRLARAADRRLSRAYLNRAYEASRVGDALLIRRCLRQALRLWPGTLGTIIRDPRLAARLAAGFVAPGRSTR